MEQIASAIIVVAALVTAAFVETHGGAPDPYLYVASLALGYGVGHTVQKSRQGK